MQSKDRQSEIEALELELAEKEILLETFLNKNEVFQRAKVILHEISELKDKLEKLKNQQVK